MPVSVAQDSESGEVQRNSWMWAMVRRNETTPEKMSEGRSFWVSAQPGGVVPLAVERFGAAGMSYAQNQRTAWWGENENLVRWGHLDTFATKPTFAFMISLASTPLSATTVARREDPTSSYCTRRQTFGLLRDCYCNYSRRRSELRGQEIAFSCHLDHQSLGPTTTPADV